MKHKKRTRADRKVRRLVRLCRCRKPSFGLCTPVCMSDEGRALIQTVYGIDAFQPADETLYRDFSDFLRASGLDVNSLLKLP